MDAKEFDRIQAISKKLKELFHRDNVGGLNGMEDYLVRTVEEATRLTKRAADASPDGEGKSEGY